MRRHLVHGCGELLNGGAGLLERGSLALRPLGQLLGACGDLLAGRGHLLGAVLQGFDHVRELVHHDFHRGKGSDIPAVCGRKLKCQVALGDPLRHVPHDGRLGSQLVGDTAAEKPVDEKGRQEGRGAHQEDEVPDIVRRREELGIRESEADAPSRGLHGRKACRLGRSLEDVVIHAALAGDHPLCHGARAVHLAEVRLEHVLRFRMGDDQSLRVDHVGVPGFPTLSARDETIEEDRVDHQDVRADNRTCRPDGGGDGNDGPPGHLAEHGGPDIHVSRKGRGDVCPCRRRTSPRTPGWRTQRQHHQGRRT